MHLAINIIFYQICWFACIISAAKQLPLVGVATVVLAVGYHLFRARQPKTEVLLLILAAIIGAIWDSFLVAAGWLVYPSGTLIELTAPYWIVAIWVAFATTFNVSLRWFKQRLLLAAGLGAVGGPLAFLAGAGLDGVVFVDQTVGLVALAIGWGALMPTMMWLSNRFDGFALAQSVSSDSQAMRG